MEYLLSSIVLHAFRRRYVRLCEEHERLENYVVYSTEIEEGESTSKKPTLKDRIGKILRENIHYPSLLELVDYHGQVQTSGQFNTRHVMRVLKNYLFFWSRVYFEREERIMKSDGGTVALDWARLAYLPSPSEDRPIVFVLHGLLGDSQSEYVYHFCGHLIEAGYRPVVMVARGCGGLKITSGSTFSGKISSDCYECVHYLREKYPNVKMFGIGYSLGAASILHYLAHTENDAGFTAAVAVSPPWNTVNTAMYPSYLSSWWSNILANMLKVYFFQHYSTLAKCSPDEYGKISLWSLLFAGTVGEFDKLCFHAYRKITFKKAEDGKRLEAEFHRFPDLQSYYVDISAVNFVHHITVPTLGISSLDDPICLHDDCPSHDNNVHVGDTVVTVKVPFGGHLAFPEAHLTKVWSDRIAISWFKSFE